MCKKQHEHDLQPHHYSSVMLSFVLLSPHQLHLSSSHASQPKTEETITGASPADIQGLPLQQEQWRPRPHSVQCPI